MKKHYKVYNTFMCIVLLSASLLSTSFMAQAFSNNTPNTNPVLLIHGFLGKSQGASYWSKFNRLLKAEYPNEYHEEGDVFWHSWDSWGGITTRQIEKLDSVIASNISLGNSSSGKIDIVAHSFGGLLIRKYIQEKGAARIGRVVTIGTPHLGTPLARLITYCSYDLPGNEPSCSGVISSGAAQMHPHGSFVNNLNNNRPSASIQNKFMSIRSVSDEIVPWNSSLLFGDDFYNKETCNNRNMSFTQPAPLIHMGQINEPLTVDYARKFLRDGDRSSSDNTPRNFHLRRIACLYGVTLRQAGILLDGNP